MTRCWILVTMCHDASGVLWSESERIRVPDPWDLFGVRLVGPRDRDAVGHTETRT
jgi:hypothetical protein